MGVEWSEVSLRRPPALAKTKSTPNIMASPLTPEAFARRFTAETFCARSAARTDLDQTDERPASRLSVSSVCRAGEPGTDA